MTKRERKWHKRNRSNKFWNKVANAANDYAFATLKIKQLINSERPIGPLIEIQEDAIKDLQQLLQ